jgi:hypothetical protein
MMDGWACIRLDDGEEGWIPQSHVALTPDEMGASFKPSDPTASGGIAPTA